MSEFLLIAATLDVEHFRLQVNTPGPFFQMRTKTTVTLRNGRLRLLDDKARQEGQLDLGLENPFEIDRKPSLNQLLGFRQEMG